MRAPAISPASRLGRLALSLVALMLATTLAGVSAVADEPAFDAADGAAAEPDATAASELDAAGADGAVPAGNLAGEGADAASSDASGDAGDAVQAEPSVPQTLAGYLAAGELRVSADVALAAGDAEPEPVVGSFTVDGLTYAVTEEGEAALVAVAPGTLASSLADAASADSSEQAALLAGAAAEGPLAGSSGAPSGEDSGLGATSPSPALEGAASDELGLRALAIPASVEHGGAAYVVASVGPRALASCDADVVTLPATVASVDELAFRGSAVAAVEVAPGNPSYSSYDGMLFDAEQRCLLLIPEGKQGAARIPKTAEVVDPSSFSHSAGVDAIDVEAGSAAFSSRNGCLYDASGETLVHDPAATAEAALGLEGAASDESGLLALGGISARASSRDDQPGLLRIYSSYPNLYREILEEGVGVYERSLVNGWGYAPRISPVGDANQPGVWNDGGRLQLRGSLDQRFGFTYNLGPTATTGFKNRIVVQMITENGYYSPTELPMGYGYDLSAYPGLTRVLIFCDPNPSTLKLVKDNGADDEKHTVRYWEDPYSIVLPKLTKAGHWQDGWLVTTEKEAAAYGTNLEGCVNDKESPYRFSSIWSDKITTDLVFTANWIANEYSVTFRPRNGSTVSANSYMVTGCTYGKKLGDQTVPTRKGYSFLGYYALGQEVDGKTVDVQYVGADGKAVKEYDLAFNANLDAKWSPIEYTVEYKDYSGTKSLAKVKLTYDKKEATVGFDWSYRLLVMSSRLDGKDYDFSSSVTSGHTAVGWAKSAKSGKADYDFNQVCPNLSDVSGATVTLYLAEEENRARFETGWKDGDDDKAYVNIDGVAVANTGAWIRWTGDTAIFTTVVDYYDAEGYHRITFARPGYKCTGLKGVAADGKTEVAAENCAIERGATYTAQWARASFDIALDQRPGSGGSSKVTATYREAMPAATMPKRSGWKFEGYFDTPAGGNQYYNAEGQSVRAWDKTEGATLYAYWTEGEFASGTTTLRPNGLGDVTTVRYNADGSENWRYGTADVRDAGFASAKVMPDGLLGWERGFTFNAVFHSPYKAQGKPSPAGDIRSIGWSRSPDGSQPLPVGYTLTSNEGILYAVWRSYDIEFNLSGGTGSPKATGTIAHELPDIAEGALPVLPGYAFNGFWADPSNYGYPLQVYGGDGKSSYVYDMDWCAGLRAKWVARPYEVAFDPTGGTWDDAGAGEAVAATFDQDVILATAPKRAGYLFGGWEVTGPDGQAYVLEAGSTLAAGKLKAAEGAAAAVPLSWAEPDAEGSAPTVALAARWVADLRVDVPISVDLDLTVNWGTGQVEASAPGTGGAEHATGEFRSWSSGAVRIAALGQEASTAAGHREAALAVFASGDEAKAANLEKVSLVVSADSDDAEAAIVPVHYLYAEGGQRAIGGMAKPIDLSPLGLEVPAATGPEAPGALEVRYGMDCKGLPLSDVAIGERRPILRLVYLVELVNP